MEKLFLVPTQIEKKYTRFNSLVMICIESQVNE